MEISLVDALPEVPAFPVVDDQRVQNHNASTGASTCGRRNAMNKKKFVSFDVDE